MPDTVRTLAALQALLADNTSRQIDPQDLRDLLVSVFGARVLLGEVLLGTDQNTMEVSGIDGSFDHLLIDYQVRASHTGNSTVNMNVGNGTIDTGASSYRWHSTGANAATSTAAALAEVARNSVPRDDETWSWCLGQLMLRDYTQAQVRQWNGTHQTHGNEPTFGIDWGQWTNAADAIDVIRFTSNVPPFITGSRLSVYGLRDNEAY